MGTAQPHCISHTKYEFVTCDFDHKYKVGYRPTIILCHSVSRSVLVLHDKLSETESIHDSCDSVISDFYSIDDARTEGWRGWSASRMKRSDAWRPLSFGITKLICKLSAHRISMFSADDTVLPSENNNHGICVATFDLGCWHCCHVVLVIHMKGNPVSFFKTESLRNKFRN
jgi:hypothetical protein